MQALRLDRGGKYLSEEFKQDCMSHGIEREPTQANKPHQNGVLERRNRTIMERARCIAADSHLPVFLWPEAVAMATFLINRSPTRSNFGIPPEASYTDKSIKLEDLKIFGSLAFVHVPDRERRKLDHKLSKRCMFVGYDLQLKAYRVYDNTRKKIIITHGVVFDKARVGFHHLQEEASSNTSPSRFPAPSPLVDSILESRSSSSLESVRKDRSVAFLASPFNHSRAISSPLTPNVDLNTSGTPCSITPSSVLVGTDIQEHGQLHKPNLEVSPRDHSGGLTLGYSKNELPPTVL